MRNRILPILVAVPILLAAPVVASLAPALMVAAEPAAPPVVDGFSRAVLGGWGAPEPSLRWVPDGGREAFSVGRGEAAITIDEAGTGRAIAQEGVRATDVELVARFGLDRLPAGGNAFVYLVARHQGEQELRLKARVDEAGAVFLQPTAADGRQEAGIGEEVAAADVVVGPGRTFWLRARVTGSVPTTLRMRAWRDGDPEPGSWSVEATDSLARVTRSGITGVRAYLGGTVADLPVRVSMDDWSAQVLDPSGRPLASPSADPSPDPSPGSPPPSDPALPAGTELIRDAFGRDLPRTWGEATLGGRWTHPGGGNPFRVEDGRGIVTVPAGETQSALLPLRQHDVLASATLRAVTLPADGNAWAYLVLRQTAGSEARGRARIAPDGSVHLSIGLVEDGDERQLGPEVRPDGLATGPGAPVRMRLAGVTDAWGGTTWKLKAWPATTAEPDAWTLQARDATPALQGAGAAGLRFYTGRSVSNGPVIVAVDQVQLLAADEATGEADPVLVGAGDIATCGSEASERTARLLDVIPGTVMAVGDLANRDGTAEQFRDCYDPTWGRHRDRTLPILGNREYATPGASGWFDYWGPQGAPPNGRQVRDMGAWRVYALDSQCSATGCGPDSAQLAWLKADLAAEPRACALALFHRPRLTSGPHGDAVELGPLWETLHAAGVDLVVSGHDHDYERFLPAAADGSFDTSGGTVQFVVGTGGSGGVTFARRRAGSVAREGRTLGVLRLTLRPDGYDWRFVPVAGARFSDSGRADCH